MAYVPIGYRNYGDPHENDTCKVLITNAYQEDVNLVLSGDPNQEDTRSQWLWLRFPDGTLILGVFPQGEQYFNVERGVERSIKELKDPQDRTDIPDAWCSHCGGGIDLISGEYWGTPPDGDVYCTNSSDGGHEPQAHH